MLKYLPIIAVLLLSACSDKSYSSLVSDEPLDTAYIHGYVITKSRDTLFGKIQDPTGSSTNVIFKNIEGKDTLFEPQSLIAYRTGNKYFESLNLAKGDGKRKFEINTFGERMIAGPITLYKTQLKTDAVLPPTEAFIAKKSGSTDFYPAGSIYNLIPLIQDDAELARQVASHVFEDTEESKLEIIVRYNKNYLENHAK